MPRVQAQRVIPAPLPQVWQAIADLEAAPRWNKAWAKVSLLSGPPGQGALLRAEDEEGHASELEVSIWEPLRRLTFIPKASPKEDLAGRWLVLEGQSIRLEPAGERATLVTMEAQVRALGLMGLVVGWLLWPGYQRRGLIAALDGLEALFSPPGG